MIKKEDKRIKEYIKYSENIAKVTPLADIEKITIDGVPKLAEYVVMNEVSKFGFFFPKKYPIPTIKNTGKRTSNNFA